MTDDGNEDDPIILRFAIFFAKTKHEGQYYRYGDHNTPYTFHLNAVEKVLRRFNVIDKHLLAAAWLHDVLEDTDTTRDELESSFGSIVSSLVRAVTTEPGPSRKSRVKATYPKIVSCPSAIVLKLADRIANVEASLETKSKKFFDMYKNEYDEFKRALYSKNCCCRNVGTS